MLEIFPAGGLTSSVITTVWVGIWVVALMNLRFGTPLSGLVVPGYLVPLFIIKPITGFVILIEAIATYYLAKIIGYHLPRKFQFAETFGRDRFFIIVLCSVLVRVLFDGYLLPDVSAYLSLWDITFTWSHQLYSLGLVIIALTANVMWNGGLRYGLIVITSQIGLTLLIVLFILTPLTNFSLTNLGFLYEDVAISIIAGPKAYIILLITAFVASRLNLRYGWEFNGILIPALLALQLFVPEKLIITLLEAVAILIIGKWLISTPWFKQLNIEGAREILLFFNISFILKIITGFIVGAFFPDDKINDYYGFGYLLSSLLALKIYQKGRLTQIIRSTTQTAVFGGLFAIVVGFIIHQLFLVSTTQQGNINLSTIKQQTIASSVSEFRTRVYRTLIQKNSLSLSPQQAESLTSAIHYFEKYSQLNDTKSFEMGLTRLKSKGFTATRLPDDVLAISSQSIDAPFLLLYRLYSTNKLLLSVPFSIEEKSAADVASLFFTTLSAKILFFDSEERYFTKPQLKHTQRSILTQIIDRYDYSAMQFRFQPLEAEGSSETEQKKENRLAITGELRKEIPITLWQSLLPDLNISWGKSGLDSVLSKANNEFAELIVGISGIRRLMAGARESDFKDKLNSLPIEKIEIRPWLEQQLQNLSKKGSQKYQLWEPNELILWNIEVIEPLLAIREQFIQGESLLSLSPQLEKINDFLLVYDYQIAHMTDHKTRSSFLTLRPMNSRGQARGWGYYFFSITYNQPYYVQAPHPIYEKDTELFGYDLAQILKAKAFIMAGAHPLTRSDGSADVVKFKNKHSLFNLVHQALTSFYKTRPALIVQVRSHKRNLIVPAPTILSFRHQKLPESHAPLSQQLVQTLNDSGVRSIEQDGSVLTAGFEMSDSIQSKFLRFSENTEMVTIWLSPDLRSSFTLNNFSKLAVLAPEIEYPSIVDVSSWLKKAKWLMLEKEQQARISQQIELFLVDKNILQLAKITAEYPSLHWRVNQDKDSKLFLLSLESNNNELVIVLNPSTFFKGISIDNHKNSNSIKRLLGILGYMELSN